VSSVGIIVVRNRVYQPPAPSEAFPIAWKMGTRLCVPDSMTGASSRKDEMSTRIAVSLVMGRPPPCVSCRDASVSFEE
jgi:hypothetical protein